MTNASLDAFFSQHPVFTVEEVDRFLADRRGGRLQNPQTRQALLGHYRRQGRLRHVRRGLYAVSPPGQGIEAFPSDGIASSTVGSVNTNSFLSADPSLSADTYLIAARLAPDAVLSYHTALQIHGFAHSVREERTCLSQHKLVRPLRFAGVLYRTVSPPTALPAEDRMNLGVEIHDRQGLPVRITGLERTLVDVLDRPVLAGGWEEAWHSWEGVAVALDFAFLLRYARLLGSATTAAKLGYALETGRERLAVPDAVLEELRLLAPRQPHPAERGLRQGTRLVRPWNLLVPEASLDEPSMDEMTKGDWEPEHEEDWDLESSEQKSGGEKSGEREGDVGKSSAQGTPIQRDQAWGLKV